MVPEIVPHGSAAQSGGEVLDGVDVAAIGRGGEVAHPAVGEERPERVDVRAAEGDQVGLEDRVAHVQERRVGRRELHAAGDDRLRRRRSRAAARMSHRVWAQISPSACTSGRPMIVPKSPYVYPPGPLPAVPAQSDAVDADRAVDRLRAEDASSPAEYRKMIASPFAGVSKNQPLVVGEVDRVPVAPRLAHRRPTAARSAPGSRPG